MLTRIPTLLNFDFAQGYHQFPCKQTYNPHKALQLMSQTDNSIPFGILNTLESGLIILALCSVSLAPLLPTPISKPKTPPQEFNTHWDEESQAALRGMQMSNMSHVESGVTIDGGVVLAPTPQEHSHMVC